MNGLSLISKEESMENSRGFARTLVQSIVHWISSDQQSIDDHLLLVKSHTNLDQSNNFEYVHHSSHKNLLKTLVKIIIQDQTLSPSRWSLNDGVRLELCSSIITNGSLFVDFCVAMYGYNCPLSWKRVWNFKALINYINAEKNDERMEMIITVSIFVNETSILEFDRLVGDLENVIERKSLKIIKRNSHSIQSSLLYSSENSKRSIFFLSLLFMS